MQKIQRSKRLPCLGSAVLLAVLSCSCSGGTDDSHDEQPGNEPEEGNRGGPIGKGDSPESSSQDICYDIHDYCGMTGQWEQVRAVGACQLELHNSSCGPKVEALYRCNMNAGAACSRGFGLETAPECEQLQKQVDECYADDPCPQKVRLCTRPWWYLVPEIKPTELMECRAYVYDHYCSAEYRAQFECVNNSNQCFLEPERCKPLGAEARKCYEENMFNKM